MCLTYSTGEGGAEAPKASPLESATDFNSQHNNSNNVVLAMTMPYSGQG